MKGNLTMRRNIWVYLVFIILLASTGCSKSTLPPAAGLTPQGAESLKEWKLPDNLMQQGEGNSNRVMVGDKWNSKSMLELSAGGSGQMEYFIDIAAEPAVVANFELQFLSTQGIGRIKISSLDPNGTVLQTVGWVVTGPLPSNSPSIRWIDARSSANYKGDWMKAVYNISDVLKKQLTATVKGQKYRLSVEVGQGQHLLIKEFGLGIDNARLVSVMPEPAELKASIGDVLPIKTVVYNNGLKTMKNIEIKVDEPYGYGLAAVNSVQIIDVLQPGEKRELSWELKALRANAVNLNKPWVVGFTVNGSKTPDGVQVEVADLRPGKVFYVMTEDLEPIDAAGYPTAWGNMNGWLEPQEYIVQMVNKAERLNAIAEQHGAKWTHYIAWPAVKAAEWADSQSNTGKWQQAVEAIKQSVKNEAQKGHEYGIHMHSDYDPYLPGNVLSYNKTVDGLWANHLKHGWAHSTAAEGDFSDSTSRVGLLYSYQRIIDELSSSTKQGQILTARAGSFDFGNGSADEAMSTAASRKVGLWGSSDADGNAGGMTSAEYGKEVYFAGQDDINKPATNLNNLGIVEFRPTPREFISYDSQSAAVMNARADQGMAVFMQNGQVKPGVQAIVGFTHAMFVMGKGDWQSVEGGQFSAIDEHLQYLRNTYADKGTLTFGTATELVRAYIDYYTPQPVAIYGQRLNKTAWSDEFAIDILGRDIIIDAGHAHTVAVKYPLYYRDSAYRISILKDGQPIYSTWGLPTPFNDIRFTVDDAQAKYTLKIYHNELIFSIMTKLHAIREKLNFIPK